MNISVSDDILQATRMTTLEISQELAVLLYQKEKLSLGQASRLAEMNRIQFQHLLASREIPIHYSIDDLKSDLATLERLSKK